MGWHRKGVEVKRSWKTANISVKKSKLYASPSTATEINRLDEFVTCYRCVSAEASIRYILKALLLIHDSCHAKYFGLETLPTKV